MAPGLPRSQIYLLLATIVLAALAAAMFLSAPLSSEGRPRPRFDLRVADQNGRMRVDWDAANPAVQRAEGATLEVEDGGVVNRYPVGPDVLGKGGLDYVRRSDDVLLTLTLFYDGRPGVQSTLRRISPVQPNVTNAESSAIREPITRSRRR